MPLESKPALRARLTADRKALSPEDRASRSETICHRVMTLPALAGARTIALYAPAGAEVETAALARWANEARLLVVYPRVEPGTRQLAFAACPEPLLVPGALGVREPPRFVAPLPYAWIDLLCVPGLAFDAAGRRLGRGGGHYDATLAALGGRVPRVGLAFELQVVDEVPAEAHDARVDVVATERRLLVRPPG